MPRRKKIREFNNKQLNELFARWGDDHVESMMMMARNSQKKDEDGNPIPRLVNELGPKEGWKLHFDVCRELAQYQHPKLRQVELNAKTDHTINITVKQFKCQGGSVSAIPRSEIKALTGQVIDAQVEVEEPETEKEES